MVRNTDSPNNSRQKSPRQGSPMSQKQRLKLLFSKASMEGSINEDSGSGSIEKNETFTPRTGSLIPSLGNPNLAFMKGRILSHNILQNQQSIQSNSIAMFQSVHYKP